ncbi:MAG TPA: 8-oxo-dGTP diphosphatase [Candidatus Saccharimonadales bacterium]|nr:8-oxo-dGTP diphosphatase [Candidatus Saccharimonadales bacterium]
MKQATLLFLVQDDQILLAMKKRGFGVNRYNGVGGKIEPGESIMEAAIRECQEEIGVTPIAPIKVARLTFKNQEEEEKGMLVHVFVAHEWEGQPEESEEMAPEWFYMDMIPYDKMWTDDAHWLPHVLEGNGVIASFTFDKDDEILQHDLSVVDVERIE